MKREPEDKLVRKQAAEAVLKSVRPTRWFEQAVSAKNARRLHEEAPFVSTSTAERIITQAHQVSMYGAYQMLRHCAQAYLASEEDARWGGRYAN